MLNTHSSSSDDDDGDEGDDSDEGWKDEDDGGGDDDDDDDDGRTDGRKQPHRANTTLCAPRGKVPGLLRLGGEESKQEREEKENGERDTGEREKRSLVYSLKLHVISCCSLFFSRFLPSN